MHKVEIEEPAAYEDLAYNGGLFRNAVLMSYQLQMIELSSDVGYFNF